MTITPSSASWATSSSGSSRGSAETRIRSYGAPSGQPSTPGAAVRIEAHGCPVARQVRRPERRPAPAPAPRPTTSPVGPVRWASSAVVQPDPAPTSSTRCPGRTSSSRSIAATVRGWELVWPRPIWSGPSYDARRRAAGAGTPPAGRPRTRWSTASMPPTVPRGPGRWPVSVAPWQGLTRGPTDPSVRSSPRQMLPRIGAVMARLPERGRGERLGRHPLAGRAGHDRPRLRRRGPAVPDHLPRRARRGDGLRAPRGALLPRAAGARNVVGMLLDDDTDWDELGRAAHRLLLPAGAAAARRAGRPPA